MDQLQKKKFSNFNSGTVTWAGHHYSKLMVVSGPKSLNDQTKARLHPTNKGAQTQGGTILNSELPPSSGCQTLFQPNRDDRRRRLSQCSPSRTIKVSEIHQGTSKDPSLLGAQNTKMIDDLQLETRPSGVQQCQSPKSRDDTNYIDLPIRRPLFPVGSR